MSFDSLLILEMDIDTHMSEIPRHCVSSNKALPTSNLVVLVDQTPGCCWLQNSNVHAPCQYGIRVKVIRVQHTGRSSVLLDV